MQTYLQFLASVLVFLFVPVLSQLDQFMYAGFKDVGHNNLTLDGTAVIEKNGIIRLTNDTNRIMGHAFYSLPFQLKNSTTGKAFSFSSSFALAVVSEFPKFGGHGMAFTIAPSKHLKGLPIQYLGLLNSSSVGNFSNHLFAVEFDTAKDIDFGDINDNHVGIDINTLKSNVSVTAGYYINDSTKQDINIKSGKPILVWVDYDSSVNLVSVTLSLTSIKPKKPILSLNMDLSPIFLDTMYVGFSASTGMLASSHYLLGWSFKINGPASRLDLSSLPQPPQPKKKHSSLILLITGISLTALVIALCFVAFGKASTSSDVFAFGALLLEVACGRRPIEPNALQEELVLVEWVWEKYKQGRLLEVVDPKLNGCFDECEVIMVLKLGMICSNDVPTIRPCMRQVVRILDGEVELPNELRKPGIIDSQEGFDEFLHSFGTSNSFDKTSSSSYLANKDVNTNTSSISFANSP
ncbi:hypothetical protein TSUD_163530 [Trifolium subterraneum]|uniref:non-specific serine/threonine protein kinase n=1 Tax=Trifolium subterraneum TaxID=3900 RepID=A0A2Z6N1T1_TRISU|nr:hypothetical protein TSUD_163530 [Trifolium subterraneum]